MNSVFTDKGPTMRHLLTVLVALSLTGCGLAPNSSQRLATERQALLKARSLTSESLYPADLGTRWRYRTMARSGDGPERPGAEQVFTIVQAETASGSHQAVMERRFGDRPMLPTLIVRNAEGVTLSRYLRPEDGSLTVLKWPLTPGMSWAGRTWPQAQETITYEGTQSVTVPAGTYTAAKLEHRIQYKTGNVDQLHYWYAPGFGMVKAVEGLTVDLGQGPVKHQVTCELTSFETATGSVGLQP